MAAGYNFHLTLMSTFLQPPFDIRKVATVGRASAYAPLDTGPLKLYSTTVVDVKSHLKLWF